MKRLNMLDRLEAEWDGCQACDLSTQRSKVVHWRGNPDAKVFLIGEAPGADEDRSGLPFVGAAGRLLDLALEHAGLDSSEDVFIANVVGCRPPGNRTPDRTEVAACAPRLQFLLKIVEPKVLVLLGATAARLAGISSVTAHRGSVHMVDILCYDGVVRDWPAVITFHPAYLLRTGGEKGDAFNKVLKDLANASQLALA